MRSIALDIPTVLQHVELFAGLSGTGLAEIAAVTRLSRAENGEILFSQEQRPRTCYYIVHGQVSLAVASDQGDEKVIELYGEGKMFGLRDLYSTQPSPCYAQAVDATLLLQIGKIGIERAMAHDPSFSLRLLSFMADRAASLEQDIAAYSFHSGYRRVVDFLLRQFDDSGDGEATLHLPVRKGLIAARLGLTPETFSRVLRELSEAQLIEVRGRHVTLQPKLMERRHHAAPSTVSSERSTVRNRRRGDPFSERGVSSEPFGSRGWVPQVPS